MSLNVHKASARFDYLARSLMTATLVYQETSGSLKFPNRQQPGHANRSNRKQESLLTTRTKY